MAVVKIVISILKITCGFLFLGRAWQHIVFDAPFRALFWDQKLLENFVVRFFDMSWHEFVTSSAIDQGIQNLIKGFGWFYLACALATLLVAQSKKIYGYFLIAGSVALVFLAYLYFKDIRHELAQFTEYTAQFTTPFFLYLVVYKEVSLKTFNVMVKIAIALTFISHGLYAIGFPYSRPGDFVDMIILSLGVTESAAHTILTIAGILDFALAVFIFVPGLSIPFLAYAVAWGFLTALARVVANFYFDFALDTLTSWLPEMLVRVPHATLPLIALVIDRRAREG